MPTNRFVQVRRNDFPTLARTMPQAVGRGIAAAGRQGEGYVKRLIGDSPADGVDYGGHIASSPGNPPRIDTGNLVNQINVSQQGQFVWVIRSGADYGPDLEFGTSKMAARPYMGPMAFWLENEIDGIVGEYISNAVE
jgi:hypothetical protein